MRSCNKAWCRRRSPADLARRIEATSKWGDVVAKVGIKEQEVR